MSLRLVSENSAKMLLWDRVKRKSVLDKEHKRLKHNSDAFSTFLKCFWNVWGLWLYIRDVDVQYVCECSQCPKIDLSKQCIIIKCLLGTTVGRFKAVVFAIKSLVSLLYDSELLDPPNPLYHPHHSSTLQAAKTELCIKQARLANIRSRSVDVCNDRG